MMLAIQGNREIATALAATCKAAYSWVVPVLYSTVILDSPERIVAFQTVLQKSKEEAESQRGALVLTEPLGAYVRHLWLGPTQVEQVCSVEATLDLVLPLCSSLLSVVVQQCVSAIDLESVVDYLPSTLQSLCIFPCASCAASTNFMKMPLDISNISRLASLHDITVVRRRLSVDLLHRLEEMPNLCGGITQIIRSRNPDSRGEMLIRLSTIHQAKNAAHEHIAGFPKSLRREIVFVTNDARNNMDELYLNMQGAILGNTRSFPAGRGWPPHITIRFKNSRAEGDELKILYDGWIARCHPFSPCRVNV